MELNTYSLDTEEIQLLDDVAKKVTHRGQAVLCNDELLHFETILSEFNLFKTYTNLELLNIFKIFDSSNNSQLHHMRALTEMSNKGMKYVLEDNYIMCYFELQKSVGNVIIRPESIGDKLSEIFVKVETDFISHPEFSKKYYVLAEDKNLVTLNMSPKVLSAIEKLDGLYIEIKGDKAIASTLVSMNNDNIEGLLQFCKEVSKAIN